MPPAHISVCIIDENLPVPPDRRVWREALALTEAGYRVSVICPKGSGFENSYESLHGVDIYRYGAVEASSRFGYLGEYGWALFAQLALALKVYVRTRFRVLQGCNPPDTIFLIALFFKLFGVRYVFDQHDPTPELYEAKFGRKGVLYWLARCAERLTFWVADVSIASNDSCQEITTIRGQVPLNRSFVVKGCPDLTDFPPRPARPELKAGREYLVLYVGLIGSQDGVELLLESVEYLVKSKERRDILFALVGSGPEQPRMKALAESRGLGNFVTFTGALYGADLFAYFATADVAVAPDPSNALNNKLTMVKVLEYMASGLPVVMYDLVEGRISSGDAAIYVAGNDTAEFGEAIAVLLDSQAMRQKLGAIGRRRIETSLNWDVQKEVFLEAYTTALGCAASEPAQNERWGGCQTKARDRLTKR